MSGLMSAIYRDQYICISKYYSFPGNINYFYNQLRMSEDSNSSDDFDNDEEVKHIDRDC
jgi:hypothetical protein